MEEQVERKVVGKRAKGTASKDVVSIKLDEDAIRERAYEISQQGPSWDDSVWFLAEAELRLQPAYDNPRLAPSSLAELGNVIQVNPKHVADQPSEDYIRALAEKIAQSSPRLEELHWFVAERRWILDQLHL